MELPSWITPERVLDALAALAIFAIGLVIARVASYLARRAVEPRFGVQAALIARRVVGASVSALAAIAALRAVGVDLSVLLGAAGVLTVAVGFASQTAASNLISGLFLLTERPFQVGDVVQVGDTTGEVVAIDVLSVKLRTFDNLLVRVPNETILKAEIRNLTAFPIRRVDIAVVVPFEADLDKVRDALVRASESHPLCLDEPRPSAMVTGLGPDGANVQLSAWAVTANFLVLKNELANRVLRALEEAGAAAVLPRRHVRVEST